MEGAKVAVNALITEPVLQQRLAKYLVRECFRNSELENLQAGTVPDSKTGDYSDVVVKTPFGEIPWRDLSRFDDAEMKRLMLDVVNRTTTSFIASSTRTQAANSCFASPAPIWFHSGKTYAVWAGTRRNHTPEVVGARSRAGMYGRSAQAKAFKSTADHPSPV